MSNNSHFSVTILGNGSAVPLHNRNLTAQLVKHQKNQFLVDCGEGTQHQLFKLHTKHGNLNTIFISHLHGDHFYGLFGLVSTFNLLGREKPLSIYAPAMLKPLMEHVLQVSDIKLRFEYHFFALEDFKNSPLIQNELLTINSFPVHHSIPTWGFKFTEQPQRRKLKKTFINTYHPSIDQIKCLVQGEDFKTTEGIILKNIQITNPPSPNKSYAYCADTAYNEQLIEDIFQTDLLYHEATFDNSMTQLASDRLHSTASQAATLAKKAQVKKLIIGHFSARFKNLNPLLEEAKIIFNNTILSEEGVCYKI